MSIPAVICQSKEAHQLELNSHIIQDYTQQETSWGEKKKQDSATRNYVIHNALSQHSIVIMNALKMLTHTSLGEKKQKQNNAPLPAKSSK